MSLWTLVSEYLSQVLKWLGAALVGTLLTYLCGKYKNLFNSRKRWLSKVMRPAKVFNSTNHFVLPSSHKRIIKLGNHTKLQQLVPVMTYGDALSFGCVHGLLSLLKASMDIFFYDTDNKKNNIFCFGGPAVNEACARAFRLVEDSVQFSKIPGRGYAKIVDKYNDREFDYKPTCKDFGVILKISNPADREKVYVCFAGIEQDGTAGSAHFFVENLRKISKMANKRNFAIIVEVDIPHSHTSAKKVSFIPLGTAR